MRGGKLGLKETTENEINQSPVLIANEMPYIFSLYTTQCKGIHTFMEVRTKPRIIYYRTFARACDDCQTKIYTHVIE